MSVHGPHLDDRNPVRTRAVNKLRVQCRRGRLGLGPNLADRLLDLTHAEARLLVHSDLAVGEELELVIEPVASGRGVRVVGEVTRVDPDTSGCNAVGVRFPHFLSYAQLQQLK
jgi:hypothetical protein